MAVFYLFFIQINASVRRILHRPQGKLRMKQAGASRRIIYFYQKNWRIPPERFHAPTERIFCTINNLHRVRLIIFMPHDY